MSKTDEQEILRRLQLFSKIEPNSADTERAIQSIRDILANEQKQQKTSNTAIWRMIYKSKITKLAAAVIIIAIGLSLVHRGPGEQVDSPSIRKVTKSPAELLTARSLTIAYRQGDIHTVEDQLDRALEMLGAAPEEISIDKLLAEFNGT